MRPRYAARLTVLPGPLGRWRHGRGRDGTSDGLSLEEATAIRREHAREGRLDLDDPEIRHLVGEANRMLVRTQMWGETPPTPRRRWKRGVSRSVPRRSSRSG